MAEYKNRHWEQNEVNKYDIPIFELHFNEFYNDKEILRFAQDNKDSEQFNYRSDMLNVEDDCIFADGLDDAKEQFEEIIIDYIEEEINKYEEMLEKFNETVN